MDERGKPVARQEVALLSSVLAFGVGVGWLRSNALRGMKFGKVVRRQRYITDAELAATLEKASPEVAQAIRFMHYTALRVSDALAVRWRDWKADGLHVRIAKTKTPMVFERTPGLEGLMGEMRNRRIGSLHVLAERNGSAWNYKRLYAEWQKVAPEGANLHDLRRKRITDLTRERGLEYAQAVAAHADPRQTKGYDVGGKRVRL
jgi:integrase